MTSSIKPLYNISIAIQGGGSHGAFAWGVLDRLLEDGRFKINGISGTSAGGMNAASAVQGLLEGSPQKARQKLDAYWQRISEMSAKMRFENFTGEEDDEFLNSSQKLFDLHHNIFQAITAASIDFFSPYQFNPFNKNPLVDFMNDFFDYDLFRNNLNHRIFLGSTHVKSGKIKVFSNEDMCSNVLMASACLPQLFQTVQVDGEPYWDGGYIANPAIYPLMPLEGNDIVIIQLTKTYCDKIPTTKDAITNRLKEITYNGCLVREMRAIHFISKLIDEGKVKDGALKRFNMHLLKSEETFKDLTLKSAMNPKWEFITALKKKGRETAETWIEEYTSMTNEERRISTDKTFIDFVS